MGNKKNTRRVVDMSPNFPKFGDYDNDNDPWEGPTIREYSDTEITDKAIRWFCIGAASATVFWHLIDWWNS